jgi:copper transport protein
VTLTFGESVGISGIGYLHVTDQAGNRVDARAAYHPGGDGTKVADDLQTGLGDGTYTASWRVISADSHPVAGSIAFVVGNGPLVRGTTSQSGTVSPATGDVFDVARWVSYVGLALLGGGWLIFTIWPAGRDEPRARRIVWGGWAAIAAGGVLELVLQGPYSAGSGPREVTSGSLLDDTLHTEYGQLHSLRLVLLGLLAAVLARSLQPEARGSRRDAVAGALGVGIVWTFSRAGHGATTPPSWLSVPIDMVHVLAMATWVGGLLMLVGAVFPRRDPDELGDVLPVFSNVAFASVTLLVASGTYVAWRGIGTVHAIFHTTYGLLVVGKIILLAGILTVANMSRRLVRRRVVAYAMTDALVETEPETGEDEIATERLRRAVWVEAIVALVVLGFTAVLVAEPRGKEALLADYRKPVSATAPLAGGRSLEVTVTPGTHGPVSITVQLSNGSHPKSITATATQPDQQIGPLPIKLARDGAGRYGGTVTLPVAGAWELDFVVATSIFNATTTDTTIRLH